MIQTYATVTLDQLTSFDYMLATGTPEVLLGVPTKFTIYTIYTPKVSNARH